MNRFYRVIGVISVLMLLTGCGDSTSGKACLGENHDSLVENLQDQCKAGDIVATKNPAYFCDFKYSVSFNTVGSAFCIYSGSTKPERTLGKEI